MSPSKKRKVPILEFIYSLIISCALVGCFSENVPPVEIKAIDMEVFRLDKAIFSADSSTAEATHLQLKDELPKFYDRYFTDILQLGDPASPTAAQNLNSFISFELSKRAQVEIDSVFGELENVNAEFKKAFGRYATLYPERKVPQVIAMNTGFNFGVYPTDEVLALGLEFYIGADNSLVKVLPGDKFPQYMRDKMEPKQLLPNAVKGFLLVQEQESLKGDALLDHMVFYGKILHIVNRILPNVPESRQFGYTKAEMQWCEDNEFQIWQVIVRDELLFSKDRKMLRNWTGNAPFTQGFDSNSPGQLAHFVGNRMVMDYMKENAHLTPEQLMKVEPNEILRAYKPK